MTYLEHYEQYIEPNLQAIDIFIKTEEAITSDKVCNLLAIKEKELYELLKNNNIIQLNKITFFHIMTLGSSKICQLFKRELDCGLTPHYTSKDISYIYNLPIEEVEYALDKVDAPAITSQNMKEVFAKIPFRHYAV